MYGFLGEFDTFNGVIEDQRNFDSEAQGSQVTRCLYLALCTVAFAIFNFTRCVPLEVIFA